MFPENALMLYRDLIRQAHQLCALSEEMHIKIRQLDDALQGEFHLPDIEMKSEQQIRCSQELLQLLCQSYDEIDAVLSQDFTQPSVV